MAALNRRNCPGKIPQNWNWQKSSYPGKTPHLHRWYIGSSNWASSKGIFLFPFCSAIALPTPPTESKGEGEIRGRNNPFHENVPIRYSNCNAFAALTHAHTHTHRAKGWPYSCGFSFSCTEGCCLGQGEILHPRSWSCRADTRARLQAAAWLQFSELYCPLQKNSSVESDK